MIIWNFEIYCKLSHELYASFLFTNWPVEKSSMSWPRVSITVLDVRETGHGFLTMVGGIHCIIYVRMIHKITTSAKSLFFLLYYSIHAHETAKSCEKITNSNRNN